MEKAAIPPDTGVEDGWLAEVPVVDVPEVPDAEEDDVVDVDVDVDVDVEAGLMVKLYVELAVLDAPSVTRSAKEYVDAVVGMPEIRPALLMERPGGRLPEANAQE